VVVLEDTAAEIARFCEDCGTPLDATDPAQAPPAAGPPAPDDTPPSEAGEVPVARLEDAPTFGAPTPRAPVAPPAEPDRPRRRRAPLRRRRRPEPSMTPGGVKLGPLDFGGVVANSFTLLFRNAGHYLLLAVLVGVPVYFLTNLAQILVQKSGEANDPVIALVGIGINVVGTLAASTFLPGCMAHSVAKHYLEEPVSIRDSLSKALFKLHIIIGATFLMWFVCFAGFLLFIPAAAAGPNYLVIAFIILFAWAIPAVVLFFSFFVYVPSILIENTGPVEALKRSWFLMKGIRLRTFGVMFVVALLFGMLGAPFQVVATILTLQGGPGELITLTGGTAVQSANSLVLAAIVVVTYFDARVRREGFGLKNLAELFE
jgi:hypothetical protein